MTNIDIEALVYLQNCFMSENQYFIYSVNLQSPTWPKLHKVIHVSTILVWLKYRCTK